jgi:rSAM/selenodomain-associated transferase 1
MEDALLIIFAKNLEYGKVKTRLAATLGNEKAFNIYKKLLQYTNEVTLSLPCRKMVYYSDYIVQNDLWKGYLKLLQHGNDLGERMKNAFKEAFANGYNKAVIIGTDCFEITRLIIERAFEKLDETDIVIGPAADGGYYLLGMKKLYPALFENIAWSTGTVFNSSIAVCNSLGLTCSMLEMLHDVDEEKDL